MVVPMATAAVLGETLTETGVGGGGFPPPVLAPPPQASSNPNSARHSVATRTTVLFLPLTCRRLKTIGIANKGSAKKKVFVKGKLAVRPGILGPVVAMVSATSVAPLPPAIELGLKLQVLKFGSPEQENVTVEGKFPPAGITWSTNAAACPGLMVCEVGVEVIEKSTELNVIANVCEMWFVSVPVATSVTLSRVATGRNGKGRARRGWCKTRRVGRAG